MTDNRTNEPTPEQIIEDALRNSYASGSALARLIVSDLHAHGLLSGGAPSEEQIERALSAWDIEYVSKHPYEATVPEIRARAMRAALAAAGVAPQEPKCEHGIALIDLCQFADHVANDESGPQEPSDAWVDRQLAAEVAAKSRKPAPLTDREKLIAEATERINEWSAENQRPSDIGMIVRLRDALAAQPVLDPVKVAEVLNRHEPIFKDGLYAGRCICGFEHPSYSGWRLHRSGALCEAYKEGKLHA